MFRDPPGTVGSGSLSATLSSEIETNNSSMNDRTSKNERSTQTRMSPETTETHKMNVRKVVKIDTNVTLGG